jgi:hypothetical protein
MPDANSAQASLHKTITKAFLRRAVHRQLMELGFSKNGRRYFISDELTKQRVRELHGVHRMERLKKERTFVLERGHDLGKV